MAVSPGLQAKIERAFDLCLQYTGEEPDRRGWAHTDCPFCGATRKHQKRFGFSEGGYNCFLCGASGSIFDLARHYGVWGSDRGFSVTPDPRRVEDRKRRQEERKKREPDLPAWRRNGQVAQELLREFELHPNRIDVWQRYRPLSSTTLRHYRFGYGKVPYWSYRWQRWERWRHDRLIVPLFNARGELVAVRARAVHPDDDHDGMKWVSAKGSEMTLWNAAEIYPGCVLWITENFGDAALVMETFGDGHVAVTTGGVSLWKRQWTRYLAGMRPRLIIIAFDNDLAGNGGGDERLHEEWQREREREGKPPINPNGPQLANHLLKAGLPVRMFPWRMFRAERKADMGDLLMAAIRRGETLPRAA